MRYKNTQSGHICTIGRHENSYFFLYVTNAQLRIIAAAINLELPPYTRFQAMCCHGNDIFVRLVSSPFFADLPPQHSTNYSPPSFYTYHQLKRFRITGFKIDEDKNWSVMEPLQNNNYLDGLRDAKMICNLDAGFIHFVNEESPLSNVHVYSLHVESKSWTYIRRPEACVGASNVFFDVDQVYMTCTGSPRDDYPMLFFNVSLLHVPTGGGTITAHYTTPKGDDGAFDPLVPFLIDPTRFATIYPPRTATMHTTLLGVHVLHRTSVNGGDGGTDHVPFAESTTLRQYWRQCMAYDRRRFYCTSILNTKNVIHAFELSPTTASGQDPSLIARSSPYSHSANHPTLSAKMPTGHENHATTMEGIRRDTLSISSVNQVTQQGATQEPLKWTTMTQDDNIYT